MGQIQERVRESTVRNERRQAESERATQRMAFFQEGLLALTRKIARVMHAAGEAPAALQMPPVITAASCMQLLQRFEGDLDDVVKSIDSQRPADYLMGVVPELPSGGFLPIDQQSAAGASSPAAKSGSANGAKRGLTVKV